MAVAVSKGVADLIKAKLEEACYEAAHDQDWKDWLATAVGGKAEALANLMDDRSLRLASAGLFSLPLDSVKGQH